MGMVDWKENHIIMYFNNVLTYYVIIQFIVYIK